LSSHQNHEHQDQAQAVIESIARREQELQGELAKAREQAAKILEEAKHKADGIFNAARQEMDKQAGSQKKQLEQDSARVMEERLAQAAGELEALEKKASQNGDRAVKAVLDYVLPGEKA
jgi:vacuolar-type H+-ATPase subunit H